MRELQVLICQVNHSKWLNTIDSDTNSNPRGFHLTSEGKLFNTQAELAIVTKKTSNFWNPDGKIS